MALDYLAQAAAPSAAQTWVPAALTAIATALVGYLTYRNARLGTRVSEREALSRDQLAWTQQAMTEAKEAKEDARFATQASKAATVAADAASRRAGDAERRLGEVTDLTGKLLEWIGRVVRKAHEVDTDEATPTDVRELIRVINGGPPEVSTATLRRGKIDP